MTYSCAVFSRGAQTLEEAQFQKLDLVCKKLDIQPGQRVLDVGCGWGSFTRHAAQHYGAQVVGHHAVGATGRRSRASGPPRPGWRTRSTSG